MLFVHDREEPQAYWMKNTHIPLDILFFDNARRLVSQQRDVPPCSLGDALPAVSERGACALRARTQCRTGRKTPPAGRRAIDDRSARRSQRTECSALAGLARHDARRRLRDHARRIYTSRLEFTGDGWMTTRLPLLATALLIARDEYPAARCRIFTTRCCRATPNTCVGEVEAIDAAGR